MHARAFSGNEASYGRGSEEVNRAGDLETGVLYCDDNLERLARFPSESVDLIYLDPPFFSNRDYELIWGDEAEARSFEDRWEGRINHYVGWMYERVMEMHRVLKPTGSIYLHCDQKASHYLKVMMDSVLGINNFRNQIVWRRTPSKGLMSRRLARNHDILLGYQMSDEATWNTDAAFTPYDPDNLDEKTASKYTHRDEDGRLYQLDNLTNPNPNRPNLTYEFLGVTKVWRWTRERMQAAYEAGLVVQPRPGAVPRLKRYLDEQRGRPLDDVWTDIDPLNSQARERLGYPTQKPEALLERILRLTTNQGDTVLDPFCGCGTTVAVAEQMRRHWVGIDISPTAVEIMKIRLEKLGARGIKTVGMPESESELRKLKPFEFQNWVIRRVDGKHSPRKTGDMGIDGFSFLEHAPIQIKRSDRVGRPVVDTFETAVERQGSDKGYIVAFSFTRGAREEVARAKTAKGLEIELVTVKDLLLGTSELVAPILNRQVFEMPLPKARPKEAMPSPRKLVESDLNSEEVA
jgi:DNA modification methylase